MEEGTDFHCFLCWGTVFLVTQGDDQVGAADELVKREVEKAETREEMEVKKQAEMMTPALLAICRYLKLEVKRGSEFGKLTFCGNCEQVVGRLSMMCQQLEVMEMKVLEELRKFDRKLEAGIQTQDVREIGNDQGRNLRRKLKQKSEAKINDTFPKVRILKQESFRNLASAITSDFPNQHNQTPGKCNSLFRGYSGGSPTYARSRIGRNHKPCPQCGKWIHIKGHWRHINWVCSRKATQRVKPSFQENLSDPLSLVDPLEAVEEPLEQKPTLPTQVAVAARFKLPFGSRLTKRLKLARCDLCGKQVARYNLKRHKQLSCKLGPQQKYRWYNEKCACDICGKDFKYYPNIYRHKRAGSCKEIFIQQGQSLGAPSRISRTENEAFTPEMEDPLKEPEQLLTVPIKVVAPVNKPVSSARLQPTRQRCDLCGKQFTRNNLKRHKQLTCKLGPRLKDRWYNVRCTCDICGKEFKYYPNLYRHKRAGSCKVAKVAFKQTPLSRVTSSLLQVENDPLQEPDCSLREQPPIVPIPSKAQMPKKKCDLCGVMLHPNNLSRHKRQMHNPEGISSRKNPPKKKCDQCGFEFYPTSLSRHKKKHCKGGITADPLQNYPGDICALQFQFPSNLNLHKEAGHQEGATSMNTDILRNLLLTPQQSEVKVETATMITGDIFDPDDT